MRYLKLYEDHKETSDKIEEIERLAKQQSVEVINEYKSLIDEMMYDITDDYETESVINIKDAERSLSRYVKTYIDYKIQFPLDKYEIFLDKLLKVVERLREAYGVTYNISAVYDVEPTRGQLTTIVGGILNYGHPFVFDKVSEMIRKHIRDNYNNYAPADVKAQIDISF
jgi:hypothetical protein